MNKAIKMCYIFVIEQQAGLPSDKKLKTINTSVQNIRCSMLKKIKAQVRLLKSELSVLLIAYKDTRTSFLPKLIIGLTIGYMLSPIDLIPDFIPILGLVDDLIIVPLLITMP